MEIYVTPNVSQQFYEAACVTLTAMPPVIRALNTKVLLGRTLHDALPDLSKEKKYLDITYRNTIDLIIMGEYYTHEKTGTVRKNDRLAGGFGHESGHAFDCQYFGSGKLGGNFSINPQNMFLDAWKKDRKEVLANPYITDEIKEFFEYFTQDNDRGVRETFAELWAHEHGASSMAKWGIDDMRPLWPRCARIVKACAMVAEERLMTYGTIYPKIL